MTEECEKFRKFGPKTELGFVGFEVEKLGRRRRSVRVCVRERRENFFLILCVLVVPLKRYVLTALAVAHFLLFFFLGNKHAENKLRK